MLCPGASSLPYIFIYIFKVLLCLYIFEVFYNLPLIDISLGW